MTAACAAVGKAETVGDLSSGWIWLPPKDLWAPWAIQTLDRNIAALTESLSQSARSFAQISNWERVSMQLTRRQIYDLVWSKPISKLAKEFDLSDQGLAKACRRFDIPVPPLGYWQKVAHGKPVGQPPLHSERFEETTKVDVAPGLKMRPTLVTTKENQSLKQASAVAEQPIKPHPILGQIRKQFERSKNPDQFLHIKVLPFTLRASPAQADRMLSLLEELFVHAQAENWKFEKVGDDWRLLSSGESIEIAVTEDFKRVSHVPTATEIRENQRNPWQKIPEFDHVPSSILKVSITNVSYLGVRMNWSDGKKQRLESVLPSFIEGISIAGAALHTRRLEKEENARQAAIREMEQARLRRLDTIQKSRFASMKQQAQQHNEAEVLRAYVAQVKQKLAGFSDDEPQRIQEWIDWAEKSIEGLDPLSKGLPIMMSEDDAYHNSWRYRDQ